MKKMATKRAVIILLTALITAAALIIVILSMRKDDEPGTDGGNSWAYFFDAPENVESMYSGTVYYTDGEKAGNPAGTAYFAMLENNRVAVAFFSNDGETSVGAIGPWEVSDDGEFIIVTNTADNNVLTLILMPSDDDEDFGYGVVFPSYGNVAGFLNER
jgi:hypothetical protein